MDGPGMSIFQGSEDLQLDTNLQQQEEDEAEEDQKRRDAELRNLVTNAFDDLTDDDDDRSTQNSSSCHSSFVTQDAHSRFVDGTENQPPPSDMKNNAGGQYSHLEGAGDSPQVSEHYRHCFRTSPYEPSNEQYRKTEYGGREQLEVLYEVREREVQRLAQQMEELKEQAAQEKDQMYRRLALAQAEKERVALQHTQSAKNLASSKDKISELEQDVDTLKLNLANVKQSNLKLSGELNAARMSVQDLEQKLSLLERSNLSNTETFLHGVQERHKKEVLDMRNQIESIAARLSAKDIECDGLRQRLTDLSRTHEGLVVEKTDTINQLMANLEESQRQCQKLVANVDSGNITAEKKQLERKVHRLEMELNAVRSDLKHYEALAQFGLLGAEDSDSFRGDYKPSNDLNIKLRDELQRCLAGLRMKRDEIKQLKAQLEDRDKVIQKMREQETAYLTQADSFKEDAASLLEQLHKYQTSKNSPEDVSKFRFQITELQSELAAAKADRNRLEGDLVTLRQASLDEKLRAIDQHSEEYIQWHDKAVARVRQEANQEIQALNTDFSIRLREAQKECDEVKQHYIEVCSSKEKLMAMLECEQQAKSDLANLLDMETEKLKKKQAELEATQRKIAELPTLQGSTEAEELRRALDTEREKVRALEVDLEASREQDKHYAVTVTEEIERAKMEALKEFELGYKQSQPALIDRASSPVRNSEADGENIARVVATLEAQRQDHLEQVKQESVRCLANELSACEARHRQQFEQAEEEYSRNLATFRGLIESKTKEVEVLKQAMLEERDKLRAEHQNNRVMEELTARIKEVENLKEQLQSCDNKWQARLTAESNHWQARIAEHQCELETEQGEMAQRIADWAEELQTLRKQNQESEIKSLELQSKYQAAKKTARQYKLWADGKERHVKQEWHRIALAFQDALEVLHAKAEAALTFTEGDSIVIKQLETQIQELRDKLVQYAPR